MKAFELFIFAITITLFLSTALLGFMGINYFTTRISDLGFFSGCRLLHDSVSSVIFIGGAIFMGYEFITKWRISSIVYLISFVLFMFFNIIFFEWVCLWILCITITHDLLKNDGKH